MRVAIIGLGLIGGSIGLALKKKNWQKAEVIGYVRRRETGQIAKEMGAVDKFESSLTETVREADIVIIATPIMTIKNILIQLAPNLRTGCIVTDTGSTKFQIMKWAQDILPPKIAFIGGHPMAGKEVFGLKAATADLFINSVYCLVQGLQSSPSVMQIIADMVENMGASPLVIDAQEHDKMVAGISHLPFLLSASLTLVTTKSSYWPQMSHLASSGYRDLTRLASGNPEVNAQICISNKPAIIHWIDQFIKKLQEVRNLVNEDDAGIQNALTIANEARKEWLKKR
jgi:prephenate dehydrogenase